MDNNEHYEKRELSTANYYKKYYQAWSRYMFWFFFIVLINVALVVIYSRFFSIMPQSAQSIMSIIIPIIIVLSLMYALLWSADIRQRNQNNFDEYDWQFDNTNPTTSRHVAKYMVGDEVVSSTKDISIVKDAISKCNASDLNEVCGDGKIFDTNKLQCVTDGFTNMNYSSIDIN